MAKFTTSGLACLNLLVSTVDVFFVFVPRSCGCSSSLAEQCLVMRKPKHNHRRVTISLIQNLMLSARVDTSTHRVCRRREYVSAV